MITNRIDGDVTVLADYQEVPGPGFVPVNAFVLHAEQPVVVDTGLSLPDRDFVGDLSEVIDPATVRWIWLTHHDRDHTGGLRAFLNPGQTPDVGDRRFESRAATCRRWGETSIDSSTWQSQPRDSTRSSAPTRLRSNNYWRRSSRRPSS